MIALKMDSLFYFILQPEFKLVLNYLMENLH